MVEVGTKVNYCLDIGIITIAWLWLGQKLLFPGYLTYYYCLVGAGTKVTIATITEIVTIACLVGVGTKVAMPRLMELLLLLGWAVGTKVTIAKTTGIVTIAW